MATAQVVHKQTPATDGTMTLARATLHIDDRFARIADAHARRSGVLRQDVYDGIACSLAHRQRTDHCGPFRDFSRADMRAFVEEQLAVTADAWRRHTAGAAGTESL